MVQPKESKTTASTSTSTTTSTSTLGTTATKPAAPVKHTEYSSNWHVRCVSAPGPDTDLTLHVSFENARFMFGCGEGTQRAYIQKRLSLKGLEAILLMNAQSRGRNGLPGVLMTAADVGIPKLNIIGPPDTAHHLATHRSSVIRDKMIVNPRSFPIGKSSNEVMEVFKSANITISAIALTPPETRDTSPSTTLNADEVIDPETFLPDLQNSRPTIFSYPEIRAWRELIIKGMFGYMTRRSQGGFTVPTLKVSDHTLKASWPVMRYPLPLPSKEEQSIDMVYICQAPDVRGKFDVARAAALGVPNGPIRGKLVRGETIEVDDIENPGSKRLVKPEECLVGGGPGSTLIVVSCSLDNIPSLVSSKAFDNYRLSASEDRKNVHLIVHRISRKVLESPTYIDWMQSFGPNTQHLIADPNSSNDEVFFRSAGWNMHQLAYIDPEIFHTPYNSSKSSSSSTHDLPSNVSIIQPNHQIKMHPPGQLEVLPNHDKDRPLLNPREYPENVKNSILRDLPDFVTAAEKARAKVLQSPLSATHSLHTRAPKKKKPGGDILVTTLGTGSAIPSKLRNVSATLLTIPNLSNGQTGGVLLDCGEGTLGQLRRRFGYDGLRSVYEQLKMIFISHMHADHHLGLQAVLEDRFKHGITSRLYIVGPHNIALALQESASWQSPASDEALSNVQYVVSPRMSKFALRRNVNGDPESLMGSPASSSIDSDSSREETEEVEMNVNGNGEAVQAAQPEELEQSKQIEQPKELEPESHSVSEEEGEAVLESEVEAEEPNPQFKPIPLHVVPPLEMEEDRFNGARRWPMEEVGFQTVASNTTHFRHVINLLEDLDLKSIQCPLVEHRGQAFGLMIRHSSGWKIVYSGDTKPSQALISSGMGATLLIHEATLDDDKPEMAELKGHSTFGQAVDVGRKMRAKHILLNHFSQRYPKMPRLPVSSEFDTAKNPIISISFDLMSIRIDEMWKMQYYHDAISVLYADEDAEEDDRDESLQIAKAEYEKSQVDKNGNGGKNQKNGKNVKTENGNGNHHAAEDGTGGSSTTTAPPISKRKQAKLNKLLAKSQSEIARPATSGTPITHGRKKRSITPISPSKLKKSRGEGVDQPNIIKSNIPNDTGETALAEPVNEQNPAPNEVESAPSGSRPRKSYDKQEPGPGDGNPPALSSKSLTTGSRIPK